MGVGSRPGCEPDVAYDETRDSGWASVLQGRNRVLPVAERSRGERRRDRRTRRTCTPGTSTSAVCPSAWPSFVSSCLLPSVVVVCCVAALRVVWLSKSFLHPCLPAHALFLRNYRHPSHILLMDNGRDGGDDDESQSIATLQWPEPPQFRFTPEEPLGPALEISAYQFQPRHVENGARGAPPSQRFWRRAKW
jgi:hypothetical protein